MNTKIEKGRLQYEGQISVVITTYNRPSALALVLEACLMQSDKNFEIIVADDGSTDETRLLVESFAERVGKQSKITIQHIWQPDQGFRAAAVRNKGIACARSEYLVFLDGDCVPQGDFIAQHRALARPGWTVIGSRILLGPRLTHQVITQRLSLPAARRLFWLYQRFSGQMNKILPLLIKLPDIPQRCINLNRFKFKWHALKGCNLAAWRADVDKVNGFDEHFIGWGHEDADFIVRLYAIGVQCKRGWHATEVFHLWHPAADRRAERGNHQRVIERIKTLQRT